MNGNFQLSNQYQPTQLCSPSSVLIAPSQYQVSNPIETFLFIPSLAQPVEPQYTRSQPLLHTIPVGQVMVTTHYECLSEPTCHPYVNIQTGPQFNPHGDSHHLLFKSQTGIRSVHLQGKRKSNAKCETAPGVERKQTDCNAISFGHSGRN